MQRLTIHLKEANNTDGKVYNTLAFIFKNEKQKNSIISKYGDNIKKQYVSNLN